MAADAARARPGRRRSPSRIWPTRPTRSGRCSPGRVRAVRRRRREPRPGRGAAGLAELAVQPDRSRARRRGPRGARRPRPGACGAVVASDECYLGLPAPGADPVSVLDPRVHGGSVDALLAVHSLSKTSKLAGYRAGFVAGDPDAGRRAARGAQARRDDRAAPVQEAMTAALTDDAHVAETRLRYDARRAVLRPALEKAGLRVDHSEAGLYLWATRGPAVPRDARGGSPSAASWSRRGSSTARPGRSTCGWRSPRPTSGSRRRRRRL